MIKKKHKIIKPEDNMQNSKKMLNIDKSFNNKETIYVEVSHTSVYIYATLLLGMMFVSGYFFGKSNTKTNQTDIGNTQQVQQQAQQAAKTQISKDVIKDLFAKNVIKFGKGDKKLLMVMVSDPSCPYCHVAAGTNNEIGAKMGPQFASGTYVAPVPEMKKLIDQGKADFVWLYTNGHGNGELASKALYCAFDQGKFWQAHDLLMSAKGYTLVNDEIKRDTSKTQIMADFLASTVNKNELKSCLDSGKYDSRLAEDSALATSLDINGTPGFYLNTTNFAGAYSWNEMKSVADAALK